MRRSSTNRIGFDRCAFMPACRDRQDRIVIVFGTGCHFFYGELSVFSKVRLHKLIDSAFRLREKADYEDFYVVAIEDDQKQIEKADTVIKLVEDYLQNRWNEET